MTNTASATIRVNPYSVTATYDKSSSAAVQANGVGGFNLNNAAAGNYVNPLDGISAIGVTAGFTPATKSMFNQGANSCVTTICSNTASSLLSVANANPVLADVYAVTDTTGTFSLDISSKNADRFTSRNTITSPSGSDIGVKTSGASSYQVTQQGVAGITATVLSPTKVEMNTDAAGGGSTGQISLTAKSLSNGVQETYSTSGSVSVDGASAYVKANTTNHIALNAVNATIDGRQTIGGATFTNTDIVATTFRRDYKNAEGELVTDQAAVLSSGNYIAKDKDKGSTSLKITADPADQLRTIDPSGVTRDKLLGNSVTKEAAPGVDPKTGTITLPDFSTQTLTASGVAWVGSGGSSASQIRTSSALTAGKAIAAGNRGDNAVSNVSINSAAGGGGVNTITSGGFGNTVNLTTTFDMTVFGR
ncbi:hypothetical protein KBZ14_09155 [Synechococcus sp. HJ21-Hayes]|nr:hypothetical protein [Synechococcus sp. HJ21-Hayes]